MSDGTRFLRTRVARRVLGLFVLSALVPVAVLAVASYLQVSQQLRAQSAARVRQASRAEGMAVIQRLNQVDARLSVIAATRAWEQGALDAADTADGVIGGSGIIRALGIASGWGPVQQLWGQMSAPPRLSNAQQQHLRDGNAILMVDNGLDGVRILMARAVGTEAAPDVLWADIDPTHVCLFHESGRPLACPSRFAEGLASVLTVAKRSQDGDVFEWREPGQARHMAAYWSVFLKYSFAAPPLTVVFSESRANAMVPIARFKYTFSLAILLAILVVFFLSKTQIRRSLDPLAELHEGTTRVSQGDFDTPVRLATGDEFEQLADSFNTMSQQLKGQFKALNAIHVLDKAVLASLSTENIAETVLSQAYEIIPCDGIVIGIRSVDGGRHPWTVSASVPSANGAERREIRLLPKEDKELREHADGVYIDSEFKHRSYLYLEPWAQASIPCTLVMPIFLKKELTAFVAFGFARRSTLDEKDLARARQLADQTGVALANARLVAELDELNLGALTALARTIDAKSSWTAGHSERVTNLALMIANRLDLPEEDCDMLRRGGLLHDIGKIGVPANILDKPEKLSLDEQRTMQSHVKIGAEILTPIRAYRDVIPIVLHHHERFDGEGYPARLKGDKIPYLARVLTVADVYDALVSDRPYRAGWEEDRALEYVRNRAGSEFDPAIVPAFLDAIALGAGNETQRAQRVVKETKTAMKWLSARSFPQNEQMVS
jgi:putative nucleotidyltransferase with HDIG domain